MAYYATAKPNLPFHKREEERRWKEHLKKHHDKVKVSQPVIQTKLGGNQDQVHVRMRLKKMQIDEDRLVTIDYANKLLMKRLIESGSKPATDSWNKNYKPRREFPNSKKQQKFEAAYRTKLTKASPESRSDERQEEDPTLQQAPIWNQRSVRRLLEEGPLKDEKEERLRELKERERVRDDGIEDIRTANKRLDGAAKLDILDNKLLDKQLERIMANIDQSVALEDPLVEKRQADRIRAIAEAQAAIRRENELLASKSKPVISNQVRPKQREGHCVDSRVQENQRLHKKLMSIKQGKGQLKPMDPEFNPSRKWWVTSPRLRERKAMEAESKLRAQERKIREEKKRAEKELENQKILDYLEEERLKNQVPEGYHKKLRKRRKKPKNEDEAATNGHSKEADAISMVNNSDLEASGNSGQEAWRASDQSTTSSSSVMLSSDGALVNGQISNAPVAEDQPAQNGSGDILRNGEAIEMSNSGVKAVDYRDEGTPSIGQASDPSKVDDIPTRSYRPSYDEDDDMEGFLSGEGILYSYNPDMELSERSTSMSDSQTDR